MGTPDFATPALKSLIHSHHEVVAVFTQAPKPKGRGLALTPSPVHELAAKHHITVYTPPTLKKEEYYQQVLNIDADIIIVVAYGFIIPGVILEAKKYGCLNIHPSKLPKFRGAAPLQRTIMSGDTETAVCIMQMDNGIDTGDILLREDFPIPSYISLQELHDLCAAKGAKLLLQTLDQVDTLPRIKQSNEGASYAHKLSKEEGKIDWSETAEVIERKIRAMNPWPCAYTNCQDLQVKILEAKAHDQEHDFAPGAILHTESMIACGEGLLGVKLIQKPGKKAMSFAEFLRGMPNLEKMN